MTKKWYKYANLNETFYSPFCIEKTEHTDFKSIDKAVEFANKATDASIHSSGLIVSTSIHESSNEEIELANGVYNFQRESMSTPDRLIPTTLRQDKSISVSKELQELESTISNFLDSKAIYEETSSIHKFGVLLFGSPGCGKTKFINDFCKSKEAIIIYTHTVPAKPFLKRLEEDTPNQLKIFVFDEVIACLDDEYEIKNMLDFLDGESTINNSIYFLATNFPEKIPENVVRVGRIDSFVQVGFPDESARVELIKFFTNRDATAEEVSITKDTSIAELRYICFTHKKTGKSIQDCVRKIKEKNKMILKHFGKTQEIAFF